MLTKHQLEDAARCGETCCCKCGNFRPGKLCIASREAAKTALAYREILERHIIEEGHYSSMEELAEVEELLKESEVEEV